MRKGVNNMYQKVSTNLNFVEREKETEKFWRENDIFKKSMENRKAEKNEIWLVACSPHILHEARVL